jgi:acyl-CoA dehydrogenase
MNFEPSAKTKEYQERVQRFMDEHVYPNEARYAEDVARDRWQPAPVIDELKAKARATKLWNLFLPPGKSPQNDEHGAGLTNLEYAPLCRTHGPRRMGREIFNCSAPDTGNMETIERYGTDAQKQAMAHAPACDGKIRSCFAMTEPAVASSDATNIESASHATAIPT